MASYPNSIYEPRVKENRSGVVYAPDKKTVLFVEDFENTDDEVVVIETELGTNPFTTNEQIVDYTLVLTDRKKIIEMNKATAVNLTVPANASVAFPLRTIIVIRQKGAGQATIVAGGGVTIQSQNNDLKLMGQYAMATLIKIATDIWALEGNLTT